MKRTAVVVGLALTLALTGCYPSAAELAQQRDECNELGGRFEQWQGGFGNTTTYCNFDQRED